MYKRQEHFLLTSSELGNIGTGRPGEVGYMPSDPVNYNEAVSGPDAERWKESERDEAQSLIDHNVFDLVAPPEGVNPNPTEFIQSGSTTGMVYRFAQEPRSGTRVL